jgi:hypothetical protein
MNMPTKFETGYYYMQGFMPCVFALATDATLTEPHRTPEPELQLLMQRLAKARPNWEFVGSRWRTEHKVWSGNNYLGTINWMKYNDSYLIDCEILDLARKRGEWTKTKDVDKAFKIILNNFVVKSDAKIAAERHNSLVAFQRSFKDTATMKHKSRMTYVLPFLEQLLFSDLDKYFNILVGLGLDPAMLSAAVDTKDAVVMWDQLSRPDAGATPLAVVNGIYYTLDGKSYSDDTLPIELRQNLGLLKLVANNDVVTGVGFRAGDSTFLVLPTKEDAT